MIGHQHIRVHHAAVADGGLAKPAKVTTTVIRHVETWLSIVALPHHVLRHVSKICLD